MGSGQPYYPIDPRGLRGPHSLFSRAKSRLPDFSNIQGMTNKHQTGLTKVSLYVSDSYRQSTFFIPAVELINDIKFFVKWSDQKQLFYYFVHP